MRAIEARAKAGQWWTAAKFDQLALAFCMAVSVLLKLLLTDAPRPWKLATRPITINEQIIPYSTAEVPVLSAASLRKKAISVSTN